MSPTIIFLNGTSSSGKTTLAKELQEQLDQPYLHLALDQFRDSLPDKFRGLNSPREAPGARGLNVVPSVNADSYTTSIVFGDTGKIMLKGMRKAMAAMAAVGNNIIVDDIILETNFLNEYLRIFQKLEVYFVGVRCPIEIVNERESNRPGRFPGTAASHLVICHEHDIYDIEVNTAAHSPKECASLILKRMQIPPTAFAELRRLRLY